MSQLPDLQTAMRFVEQLYNLIYPYQGFAKSQLTHRQAIQEIEKQLNQLCGREMTAVMVTMLTALEMNPRPNETASMLCQRLRNRLSASDVVLRFQESSGVPPVTAFQEEIIEEEKSPGPKKMHRVQSPTQLGKTDPVLESLMKPAENKEVALQKASGKGQLEAVKYLVETGANIHANDNAALKRASINGHLEVVKYLHERGVNIYAEDDKALMFAVYNGHLDVVRYLVEQGITNSTLFNALVTAARGGHLAILKYLQEKGGKIHADNEAVLRVASENGHLEIVKYLAEQGANIHVNNDESLQRASANGHLAVVKFLVEKGANIHANYDYALRWAQERGHLEVVKYLESFISFPSLP